ncbi:NAD(P)/FAD-dependent oxidoreductase [Roseospira navarrensis]
MTSNGLYDVAVIGAGVVGCAMARRFTLDGARVLVLERAPDILDGASKGNSGILHTGFDAPPDTLEQACIAAGHQEYLKIRDRLGLPLRTTGAMVVAWTEAEAARLPALMEQAHRNGVTDVRPLDRAEILERAPHINPAFHGGFLVPRESVIDPWAAPTGYLLQAIANGAHVDRNAPVQGGAFDGETWRLDLPGRSVRTRSVINCAGLYGDHVDQLLLGAPGFEIRPRKGQFVVFDKAAARLLPTILLPVPSPTTKGVVVCPTAYGNILVGPTAEEQESRADASVDGATLAMLRETAARLVPALAGQPITATYAGIRPATEEKGYRITPYPDRRYISVGGIRSTGLTAALGIARHVAGLHRACGTDWAPLAAPGWPAAPRLSETDPRDWQDRDNGGIVCHCELVTRREIEAALGGPLPARSLGGLKRRTRATMGRCQGFYCSGALAEITAGHFAAPLADPAEDRHD